MNITTHWTNHILQTNIDDDNYIGALYTHILCDIPFRHHSYDMPEEVLLNEFHKDDHIFDKHKSYVYEAINAYIENVYDLDDLEYHVKTFLVTNGKHSKTPFHNHRGAFISGVFYVNVDEFSGDLLLHDPRFNAVRATPLEISKEFEPVMLSPKNGDIVIFPSFVYHETTISFSDAPRILIPFDVYISSK